MNVNDLEELDNEVLPVRMIGEAANHAVMNGATLQQVRGSYATAVTCQVPRELAVVRRRVEEEGRLAGEEFFYGWGSGKDRIEGPSIKLANALARCWGNCAIELLPVQELADSWIFTAIFVDLETGFTLPRQFRQSKNWRVFGKHDEERKADIRFQIGQSKAIRNVILNALPASLVERALASAKSGVREKLQKYIEKNSLSAAQDLLIGELAKLGVKEDAILQRFGVAHRKALSVDNLVVLRGDLAAVADGQERPEDLFPAGGAAQTVKELGERIGAPSGNGHAGPSAGSGAKPTAEPAPSPPPRTEPPTQSPAEPEEIPALAGPPPTKRGGSKNAAVKTLRALIDEHKIPDQQVAAALVSLGLRGEEETNPPAFGIAGLSADDANRMIDELAKTGE